MVAGGGAGHQEHMMKLVGAVVLCFSGYISGRSTTRMCVFRVWKLLSATPVSSHFSSPNFFSSHLQRQHPQGHPLISIVCEMDYFSN